MTPRVLAEAGLFEVDGTWGTIQPMELAPGVRTIGEQELIEHLEGGHALVDSRLNRSPAPGDTRLEGRPDIVVPFTSADYFAGRDPVLERALS